MVRVWGSMFKLEFMDHALGFSASHHSSDMEHDTTLFHSCALDHQIREHGTNMGRRYRSFLVGVISLI